jgi:hypothetical protein
MVIQRLPRGGDGERRRGIHDALIDDLVVAKQNLEIPGEVWNCGIGWQIDDLFVQLAVLDVICEGKTERVGVL